MNLILASSSPHRRELLARLRLPFETVAPNVNESPLPDESPAKLVERLSLAKARAVATRHPDAIVIGSDQIAAIADTTPPQFLGKPSDRAAAIAQLRRLSARRVQFLTGLCVIAPVAQLQPSPASNSHAPKQRTRSHRQSRAGPPPLSTANKGIAAKDGRAGEAHRPALPQAQDIRGLGVEVTEVVFRSLTETEISNYVDREQPFGCAASFRSERLGITLVAAIHGNDPTALIGLPLIQLCKMLRGAGLNPG